MPAHAISAGPLAPAWCWHMPSVGILLLQPGMPARALCQVLSQRASGICVPPWPLPWAAMPWALQSWLPQPCLRVWGQASGSLSRNKHGICSWQCFPDCSRNCNNDNTSTTMNAIRIVDTRMAATMPTMATTIAVTMTTWPQLQLQQELWDNDGHDNIAWPQHLGHNDNGCNNNAIAAIMQPQP